MLPCKNEEYNTKDYWEARYSKIDDGKDTEDYDWFGSSSLYLNHIIQLIESLESKILILGCGNSTLGKELYERGYHDITNVDYSETLIYKMKIKYEEKYPLMSWLEMDVRNMTTFPSAIFDIIIDKGTLDVFLCVKGEDIWNPSEGVRNNVATEIDQVSRLLKPKGTFIYVTFGQPHFRVPLLKRNIWQVNYVTMGEGFSYFLYYMKKEREQDTP